MRSSSQCSCHCCASAGGTKYSISICSNSRVRKMKLPGVISLRNDLPTCAIPNGGFLRANCRTFLKLRKIPWAVSGRRKTREPSSATGPMWVSNMRLNMRGSDSSPPHSGQRSVALGLRLAQVILAPAPLALAEALDQRVGEALEVAEASHVFGCSRIAESRATMSSRSWSIERHHSFFTLFFSSTP